VCGSVYTDTGGAAVLSANRYFSYIFIPLCKRELWSLKAVHLGLGSFDF